MKKACQAFSDSNRYIGVQSEQRTKEHTAALRTTGKRFVADLNCKQAQKSAKDSVLAATEKFSPEIPQKWICN